MAGKKWSPEQLAKFRNTMKERREEKENGKTKAKARSQQPAQGDIPEAVLAYAMGRLEAWIEGYAASERVSPRTLAFRMGKLLQRKASR